VIESPPAAAAVPRPPLELAALGTGLVFVCVLLANLPSWRAELGRWQALMAIAFVFYGAALWWQRRGPEARSTGAVLLAVAIAARLALLPVTPTLSDDVWRYVWEGKVVVHGGDPYHQAPSDPALAPLRDRSIHPRINHPELATIYPPFAIAGFALVARISATLWAMKGWIVLNDLALVAVLMAWIRRRTGRVGPVLAYAWNPLVLAEYAGGAHHDPTAMLGLVIALAWADRRPVASAGALGLAVATKLAPVLALPALLRRWPWRARAVAVALVAAGGATYWMLTRGASSGLGAYWRSWTNNELAFHYLALALRDSMRARAAVLGVLTGAAAMFAWRRADPAVAARTLLRVAVVLGPVVHPWYLGWVLVLEPLGPSAPWLLLSATVLLSYGVFAPPAEGGAFHLSLAWRWVEFGIPLLLAGALTLARRRRTYPPEAA
jgi:hypothetical protein